MILPMSKKQINIVLTQTSTYIASLNSFEVLDDGEQLTGKYVDGNGLGLI
jgi:hypothetical protein